MSKHKIYRTEQHVKPSKLPIHPIWRGIGCILIIVLPVMSYFIATYFITNRNKYPWIIIPQDLIIYQIKDSLLGVKLLYAGILLLAIAAVLALLTFAIFRIFGPSRYGPRDIPPEKVTRIGQ